MAGRRIGTRPSDAARDRALQHRPAPSAQLGAVAAALPALWGAPHPAGELFLQSWGACNVGSVNSRHASLAAAQVRPGDPPHLVPDPAPRARLRALAAALASPQGALPFQRHVAGEKDPTRLASAGCQISAPTAPAVLACSCIPLHTQRAQFTCTPVWEQVATASGTSRSCNGKHKGVADALASPAGSCCMGKGSLVPRSGQQASAHTALWLGC